MLHPAPVLVAALLSIAPGRTQAAPDLLRFVPDDAVAVVRTVGLASWAEQFGKTNVGRAFAAATVQKAGRRLWTTAMAEPGFASATVSRLEALAAALAGHAGEIVVAATADLRDLADRPPKFAVMLAMAGGDDELDALEDATRQALGAGGDERRIEGESFVVHRLADYEITAPVRRHGASFVFVGAELTLAIPEFWRERQEAHAAASELRRGPFVARFELPFLLQLKDALLPVLEQREGVPPAVVEAIVDLIGLRSLGTLTYRIAADDADVVQEAVLELRAGERGLLGALLPPRTGAAGILESLPAAARNWSAWRFDTGQVLDLYRRTFEVLRDVLPMTREQVEAKFTEFAKVRLVEDVLAHVGDEALRLEDFAPPSATGEPTLDELASHGNRGCLVLKLRDATAFAASLEKALRARGLHAGRKTEDYGDARIHRFKPLGFSLEYSIAGDVLIVGIGGGETVTQYVRSILDRVAERAKGNPRAELRPEVAARLRALPADWTMLDIGSMEELLDGLVGTFDSLTSILAEAGSEAEPWLPATIEFSRCLRAAVKANGIDVTATSTTHSQGRIVMRSAW